MPESSSTAKEEQLARIRRNQQRSRDRRREHIAELESQVKALQQELQQCTPCATPASTCVSSASLDDYEQTRRENAARREMLLSLNLGDDVQRRYIDSMALREAMMGDEFPVVGDGGMGGGDIDLSNWLDGSNEISNPLNFADAMLDTDTWLADPSLQIPGSSTPQDQIWSTPLPPQQTLPPPPPQQNPPPQTVDKFKVAIDALTAFNTSADRCFLENALTFRPGKSSTDCSVAIRMILQHNRRGFSLAELHERMKSGLLAACKEDSRECQVEDAVFLKLLAEVSATG